MSSPAQPATPSSDAPHALKHHWQVAGQIGPLARWQALSGGRTNPVWHVQDGARGLICKLFRSGAATPLFINDPAAEWAALTSLRGEAVAPEPVALARTALGDSLLYRHVPGKLWSGDPVRVARVLARLHAARPPAGLPQAITDVTGLLDQGRAMVQAVSATDPLPSPPSPPSGTDLTGASFLHGDPVPGNLLQAGDQITLIDWQCPAIGDPCLDLALFLSPAMQSVNGNPPLSAAQVTRFLDAYGNLHTAARYRALAPVFHWRMAAYCLWKVQHGDAEYAPAARLELAALQQG